MKVKHIWARERAAFGTVRPVVQFLHTAAQKWHFATFFCCGQIVYSWQQSAATDGECEQHTSHVTFSQCCTCYDTHTLGSIRKFGVRTSHSVSHLHPLMLCVWFSSTFSTLLSLLLIFSLVVLSFFLAINSICHDVVDKLPVHFS